MLFLQLVDHADRVLGDLLDGGSIQTAAQPVLLGMPQGRQDDRIVQLVERAVLQVLLGQLGRLLRVAGEQPLVELDLRRQRRLVAQQDVEETELGNMAPEHDQADGERRRHQQAERAPEHGPEHRGDEHRDR